MITAKSQNGQIQFDGSLVYILKSKNVIGFLSQGIQGDRYIVARAITAVEYKEPNGRTAGFIAFDFPGKNPPRGGVFDAAADENALIFSSEHVEEFRAMRAAIMSYLQAVNMALDETFNTNWRMPD